MSQRRGATQKKNAQQSTKGTKNMSHKGNDAHDATAQQPSDLSELHLMVEQACRNRDDVQRVRIRVNNRLSALDKYGITYNPFYTDSLKAQVVDLKAMESRATREIERQMKLHPLASWIKRECPGIGLDSTAMILNATGPLNMYPNPAKVWKVLGLAVYPSGENGAGEAPDKKKFKRQKEHFNNKKHRAEDPYYSGSDYNLRAHGLCFVLGGCIEKQKAGTKYKDILNARKEHTAVTRPDWTPIHRRYDANRIAVKAFVKDMWCKWHELGLYAERIHITIEEDTQDED